MPMDQDDVNRFGTQRVAELATPLVTEIAQRFDIDLRADDGAWLRVLLDFASRMFGAGYTFGVTESTAGFLEQLPPAIKVNVQNESPPPPEPGPLGEGPEWDHPDLFRGD